MQLFYQENIEDTVTEFTFDKIESKHIIRVLRKKEGDILHLTNGKNQLFVGKIIVANDRKCKLRITEKKIVKTQRSYRVCIAIAPTKNNDRLEWFLEKATEIGVDEIYPIICEHSERKIIKKERLDKIVITAMKQSLQLQLPTLHDALSFKAFMALDHPNQKFIAYCERESDTSTRNSLKKAMQTQQDICILIGPEGDFSPKEITLALKDNFIPVSLGATRLRTETAGIVAVHTIAVLNE